MNNHWSEYWQQGHTTSFGDALSGNYEGILKSIWQPIFSGLQDGFLAVDIGTGNGSLPLLIRESLEGSDIKGEVVGIDLAEVKLTEKNLAEQSNTAIKLLSNEASESLPFATGTVDLYTSQFGFEYSDIDLSLKEASRVLKDNGQFSLVFHHANSMIINRNRKILRLVEQPEAEQLVTCLSDITVAMGKVSSPNDIARIKQDLNCEKIRAQINRLIKHLVLFDEKAAQDCQLMMFVAQFFKDGLFWPVAKKQQFIEFIKLQMDTLKLRLRELLNASFDEAKLGQFISRFNQNLLSLIELKVLKNEQNEVLAWYLSAQKNNE
ncbi:class I SAM-dependent methyltransferase [Shewanella metallivivens]|uniref:Class I SAM-dependent methyltransferase n=1 Tax=Shewanella metallivivens TaxID=2872342 RepID=A0ABT5TKP4_9GAMM|nr:class I SAM-dependent methyltransferase [Shewanella metallivivens]MDD8059184.1 class I SAM-dependent methyltransferase [Shewanella metallivivens]